MTGRSLGRLNFELIEVVRSEIYLHLGRRVGFRSKCLSYVIVYIQSVSQILNGGQVHLDNTHSLDAGYGFGD